jgi:phenylacetic acid degradation operon negative regulatory protein
MNDPSSPDGWPDDELAAVIDRLGGSLRAWSLAVSFLGDCILPRESDVGMAAITTVLATFGIEPGVTRTAMSRLASDGWVVRQRIGRNSFYSLTPIALFESDPASRRIYAACHPEDPCAWRVYLAAGMPRNEQARLRSVLRHRGAAELGSHVYVLPAGEAPRDLAPAIVLTAAPLPDTEARLLVERAFNLATLTNDYRKFTAAFAPVASSLRKGAKPAGLAAVAMRVLLIHAFRRVVLRDPLIPAPYLLDEWPGIAARETAAAIWRALFRASEDWLDANAASARGLLPPRSTAWQRF